MMPSNYMFEVNKAGGYYVLTENQITRTNRLPKREIGILLTG